MKNALFAIAVIAGWYLVCVFAVGYTFHFRDKRLFLYGALAALSPVAFLLVCAMLGIRT